LQYEIVSASSSDMSRFRLLLELLYSNEAKAKDLSCCVPK